MFRLTKKWLIVIIVVLLALLALVLATGCAPFFLHGEQVRGAAAVMTQGAHQVHDDLKSGNVTADTVDKAGDVALLADIQVAAMEGYDVIPQPEAARIASDSGERKQKIKDAQEEQAMGTWGFIGVGAVTILSLLLGTKTATIVGPWILSAIRQWRIGKDAAPVLADISSKDGIFNNRLTDALTPGALKEIDKHKAKA